MKSLYPLTFRENRLGKIWGEERWEISAHAASPSIVENGAFAGRSLSDLAAELGRDLLGSKAPSAATFPLLFKVISTNDRLSVQVHPSEATRSVAGGEPKTEMWRVLGGAGHIFAGLRPGVTRSMVADGARDGSLADSIVRIDARPGASFFIPGGLIHALGANLLIYEVQQSSDTTYRLYDWGRLDASGRPRQLHLDAALDSIDFSLPPPREQDSIDCPFFRFRAVEADGTICIPAREDSFTALYLVEQRRSVLVPANCSTEIPASGAVLETTLGDGPWS